MSQQTLGATLPTSATQPSLELYEQLVFTRRFLKKVDTLYRQGLVHGPAHLGLGQEAIAVGTGSVLRVGDSSIGTYRGHAHSIVETVETIAQRIRERLEYVPADRFLISPDCGLGYFNRTTAYAKLSNMGKAAELVRSEL